MGEYTYHFTFIPKYRRRRLVGKLKQKLSGMIKFCAQINEWEVVELGIEPDHVHLLIQTNTEDSPSSIMQSIKGGTSKKLREMFPSLAESTYLKSFWADGYYGSTVGVKDLKRVKDYVKNQQKHHEKKSGKEPADS